MSSTPWRPSVVDLFSCGGGMSSGFANDDWELKAAVDIEVAKPSGKGAGETGCNRVYAANHGIDPIAENIQDMEPADLMARLGLRKADLGCLISCAPCTDFSRANPANHTTDKARNTLVGKSGDFVETMLPRSFVMENAREMVKGNHAYHWEALRARLEALGYEVSVEIHKLSRFGLPQIRERALVIATHKCRVRSLEELWEGWELPPEVSTVRTALGRLAEWQEAHPDDPTGNVFPGQSDLVQQRLEATPSDGGSWMDVARNPKTRHLCTPQCLKRWEEGKLGSHPDVYGRVWWDRPAPTIKRECAHVGNGRYAHPVEHRLLSVREMATLQGFPFDYQFPTSAISNRYRIIGDAVPPMIARQIAAAVQWSLTGMRPEPEEWVMPDTTLRVSDIKRVSGRPVTVGRAVA
jgi:DNA (cytosine-5)-methyltransferase 1